MLFSSQGQAAIHLKVKIIMFQPTNFDQYCSSMTVSVLQLVVMGYFGTNNFHYNSILIRTTPHATACFIPLSVPSDTEFLIPNKNTTKRTKKTTICRVIKYKN